MSIDGYIGIFCYGGNNIGGSTLGGIRNTPSLSLQLELQPQPLTVVTQILSSPLPPNLASVGLDRVISYLLSSHKVGPSHSEFGSAAAAARIVLADQKQIS